MVVRVGAAISPPTSSRAGELPLFLLESADVAALFFGGATCRGPVCGVGFAAGGLIGICAELDTAVDLCDHLFADGEELLAAVGGGLLVDLSVFAGMLLLMKLAISQN